MVVRSVREDRPAFSVADEVTLLEKAMTPYCPRCGAPAGDDDPCCPSCGASLDPCRTVPPPGPVGRASSRNGRAARAARDEDPVDSAPEVEPSSPPSRPRKRRAPVPSKPPQPAYDPPRPASPTVTPPPPPAPVHPGYYPAPPAHYGPPAPMPYPPPEEGRPGKFRGLLIKMLGGNVDTTPPAPGLHPAPPAYPGYPPPVAPAQAPFQQPTPVGYWPPPTEPPAVPTPQPTSPHPVGPATPGRTPEPEEPDRGDDDRTRALGGVDVDRLKIPRHRYAIQILDPHGQWRDWGPIPANGINIGRARNSSEFPGLGSMAVRHLRLGYDHHNLVVEDLGSLNGVYLRVAGSVELTDGGRFRVGGQVIELRIAEPFDQAAPLRSDDEEEFISRDLEPLAYLDLIRPSGLPGLRFPITRREGTVIGRDGRGANVVLTDDKWVSALHAQVRFDEGRFLLEDLKSRNGTFVRVPGSSPLQAGDVLLAGKVLFRVVDPNAAG